MASLQQVHVRVNDAATGKPTPVLIRFRTPDGRHFAPHGRLTDFATGRGQDVGGNVLLEGGPWSAIDGNCEVLLPAGALTVEARKGPEHEPLRTDVTLLPGKLALRLQVRRWIDMRSRGWWPGDSQAFFLSPHAALLEGAACDLAVVNLLALEVREPGSPPAVPGILAFSGQAPALEAPGCLVAVNTYNEHAALGRLALLNSHRPVYPLRFGPPDGFDDWTLADWCDQCLRKGGLVVAADFFGGQRWRQGEVLADLLLGKVDAVDVSPGVGGRAGLTEDDLRAWYLLLDAGLRVPLVGGSAKDSNRRLLGSTRTYARLQPGKELSYAAWVEAVRAGRTFVTDSAILRLTVDGQGPGEVLDLRGASQTVRVRVEARQPDAAGAAELVVNGRVEASAPLAPEPAAEGAVPAMQLFGAVIDLDLPAGGGGWVAARVRAAPQGSPERLSAHTSPVYLTVAGQAPPPTAEAVVLLGGYFENMRRWVAQEGRFRDEQERQRLAQVFADATAAWARRQPSSA